MRSRVIVDRHGTLGLALTGNTTRHDNDSAGDYDGDAGAPHDE